MKHLIAALLIMAVAGVAAAEDTFGLWRQVDGDYVNYIYIGHVTDPFTVYITIHDPSVFSVGGYEVGITLPYADMLVLATGGPNGWTNFGDATNHLVGFQTPVIIQTEVGVLGEMELMCLSEPEGGGYIFYHASDPPSIPGHDGPVIANGVDPEDLIACGFVTGSPDVFLISDPLAVEEQTWSGVKALFD